MHDVASEPAKRLGANAQAVEPRKVLVEQLVAAFVRGIQTE